MARTKAGLFPVKTLNGSPPALMNFPLVQTAYYEGNVVRIKSATGSAALCAAAATVVAGVMACNVTNGSAASGNWPVYLLDDNTVFEAINLNSVAPQAIVGDSADILLGSTYNYRINTAASTKVLRIVGFHPDETLTAATGKRFWVKAAKTTFGSNLGDFQS